VRRADGDDAAGPGPDPDQVLTALRELVAPMLYSPAIAAAEPARGAGDEPPVMAQPPAAEPAEPAGTAATGESPVAAEPAPMARRAAARPGPAAARAGAIIPAPRNGAQSRPGAECRPGAGSRNAADRCGGIAVTGAMLARAGQLTPGYEEEETW
jgi:hypothetical protein